MTEEQVERALARPWHQIGLGALLDARFEAVTADRRTHDLRRQLIIVAIINVMCLLMDYHTMSPMVPGILGPIVLLGRLGVVLPLAVFGAWAMPRCHVPRSQGLLVALPLCALMITAAIVGKVAVGWISDRYIIAAGILIFVSNLVVQLRLPHILVLTGVQTTLFTIIACWPAGRPADQLIDLVVFFIMLAALSLRTVYRLDQSTKTAFLHDVRSQIRATALIAANRELDRLSTTDHLTGIPNRRVFEAALSASLDAAQRANGVVGLLLIDIDHFKLFNDTAGHAAGDETLKLVALAVQAEVSAGQGTVARVGGEEFAVVLPDTREGDVVKTAERIRRAVKRSGLLHPAFGGAALVTISVGATASMVTRATTPSELFAAADKALYDAKAGGRDRVVLAGASARSVPPERGISATTSDVGAAHHSRATG